jgi:hypothetical protein
MVMDKVKLKAIANTGFLYVEDHWKNILIILLILVTVRGCYVEQKGAETAAAVEVQHTFEKKSLDSTVKTWKDKFGEEHAKIKKIESDIAVKDEYIDSVTKLLGIKTKQLESIQQVRTETNQKVNVKVVPIYVDTCYTKGGDTIIYSGADSLKYDDAWTVIRGMVQRGSATAPLHIQMLDTLSIVDYWTRDKILGLKIGKARGYVDYTNKNPYNKVTGAKKWEVRPPKYKWGLGLAIGVGYPISGTPLKYIRLTVPEVSVGLFLQRTLIRF